MQGVEVGMSIYYVRLTQVHQIHGAVVVIILTPRLIQKYSGRTFSENFPFRDYSQLEI